MVMDEVQQVETLCQWELSSILKKLEQIEDWYCIYRDDILANKVLHNLPRMKEAFEEILKDIETNIFRANDYYDLWAFDEFHEQEQEEQGQMRGSTIEGVPLIPCLARGPIVHLHSHHHIWGSVLPSHRNTGNAPEANLPLAAVMASPSQGDHQQLMVERKSHVRVLTLNRPKQLNALSFYMVSRLLKVFSEDEENSDIKLVVVKGNGRSFCAGGDVAAVAREGSKGDWRYGANFFHTEYKLNYLMATYSKPQVSILNGIVMGGGAGASVHGRFRIVTENTVLFG
ncbi:unnamed protein product [Sphenostylis stenocarpa]|uniref:3-hydroxyisobutyryl-CoA hydrolase n=1 Tax=Sphenostylis stenocarpa TaxID=92480 RepID=A0AA86VB20_9FABA|nr:unnamed protein product [Sphenostylis stenocarpa]